jgi:predicted aspartyl protease
MMQGVVNLRREAMLSVVVGNSNRQLQAIEAVIDTGFNGYLSLPSTIITTLNLLGAKCEILIQISAIVTFFDHLELTT